MNGWMRLSFPDSTYQIFQDYIKYHDFQEKAQSWTGAWHEQH